MAAGADIYRAYLANQVRVPWEIAISSIVLEKIVAMLVAMALALAGVSSFIAMFELATTNLMNFGVLRDRAAIYVGVGAFLFGIPSALYITFLDNQDWVWGVGLLISGLLTALAVMRYGVEKARAEINENSDIHIGRWWSVCVRMVPVIFLIIFSWWVYQSVVDHPDTWWNPLETFSTGTMVVQWLALFVVVYLLNDVLARKVAAGPMTRDRGSSDPTDPRP